MSEPVQFRVYPSQLIHMGKRDPERPDVDYMYLSFCGRRLIGYPVDEAQDFERCKRCEKVLEHARRVYQEMEQKFLG